LPFRSANKYFANTALKIPAAALFCLLLESDSRGDYVLYAPVSCTMQPLCLIV